MYFSVYWMIYHCCEEKSKGDFNMFVRWIGAFRKKTQESVYSCIKFDMHRQTVFACEKIRKGDKSNIFARVGLAVRPENIYRNFKSDVWSVYDKDGKLKTTRSGSGSAWKESWATPENAFDAIADGTEITHSKPDPEVFLLAAQKLGAKPESCLVVEDALAGVQAGVNAGMQVAGIGEAAKVSQAAYALQEIRDLLNIAV
jgi:beta-phosphoglucomutase